jgi:hypothetical protein
MALMIGCASPLSPRSLVKELVDLDLVEREFAQLVERTISGTEIIERQADTRTVALIHRSNRAIAFFKKNPLLRRPYPTRGPAKSRSLSHRDFSLTFPQ